MKRTILLFMLIMVPLIARAGMMSSLVEIASHQDLCSPKWISIDNSPSNWGAPWGFPIRSERACGGKSTKSSMLVKKGYYREMLPDTGNIWRLLFEPNMIDTYKSEWDVRNYNDNPEIHLTPLMGQPLSSLSCLLSIHPFPYNTYPSGGPWEMNQTSSSFTYVLNAASLNPGEYVLRMDIIDTGTNTLLWTVLRHIKVTTTASGTDGMIRSAPRTLHHTKRHKK